MRALYLAGRQAEALRAFRRYHDYLAEETGLPPSDGLIDLERRITVGDPSLAPAAGEAVPGYELAEVIGEGAFGAVYRAVQPTVGREVAVKVVRPELADDPRFVQRFEAEAQLVARIEHPHVDLDERLTRESRRRPFVLTSMRRQIPSAVYQAVKAAVAAGEPDAAPRFDLANGGVGLFRTGGQIDRLEPELDAVRADIVAGRIDVPQVTSPDAVS